MRSLRASALLLLACSSAVSAQRTADSAGLTCLTAAPAPRCSVVLLTNFGMYATAGSEVAGHSHARVAMDLGALFTVGRHDAIGGSFVGSIDNDGLLTGAMVRYRHWLPDSTRSIEVGVGRLLSGSDDVTSGTIGLLKVNFTPEVGIVFRPESRFIQGYRCDQGVCGYYERHAAHFSLGIEASGKPGLILSGTASAAFLALIAIAISTFD